MHNLPPNTGETLSINPFPGQDKRILNSKSKSIFTLGDFRIQHDFDFNQVQGSKVPNFDGFSTLESLNASKLKVNDKVRSISPNEINLKKREPTNHAYFGSFFTRVSTSINNIIEKFPFAILSYDQGNGSTVFDYKNQLNKNTGEMISTFKIPLSSITNQGDVLLNSGSTDQTSLINNIEDFSIQISGENKTFDIKEYNFSGGNNAFMGFKISGFLLDGNSFTSTLPIYIRPTKEKLASFKLNLSNLEEQLLGEGIFEAPDVEKQDGTKIKKKVEWPRKIDGFNPDVKGNNFEKYKKNILQLAEVIDETKTNIFFKTVTPDNFLDFDTENNLYQKLMQTYAFEFDELKKFIDGIAFAHSINYDMEQSVPIKFMKRLNDLLGWQVPNSFSELDFFEFMTSEVNENKKDTESYFNIEVWRRILINLNFLYKKKGTRNALKFIFKLLGAPECLVKFDEFVYKIRRTVQKQNIGAFSKINENGYINYENSDFEFQEGGEGRGNGMDYIRQWEPEFDMNFTKDDLKIHKGKDEFFGTENIVNTKETNLALDPARLIECDVHRFYQLTGTCWTWSSGSQLSGTSFQFSALTTQFEYLPDCDLVSPNKISGMTIDEYIDFIYAKNVDPTTRKTNHQDFHNFYYPTLRGIYMNYFNLTHPESNRLTIGKIESYLYLIETQFKIYTDQLVPATTILNEEGTLYRNPVFNRQKFVYREGINKGSEFRIPFSPNPITNVEQPKLNSKPNVFFKGNTKPINVGTNNNITNIKTENKQANINSTVQSANISTTTTTFDLVEGITGTT